MCNKSVWSERKNGMREGVGMDRMWVGSRDMAVVTRGAQCVIHAIDKRRVRWILS